MSFMWVLVSLRGEGYAMRGGIGLAISSNLEHYARYNEHMLTKKLNPKFFINHRGVGHSKSNTL